MSKYKIFTVLIAGVILVLILSKLLNYYQNKKYLQKLPINTKKFRFLDSHLKRNLIAVMEDNGSVKLIKGNDFKNLYTIKQFNNVITAEFAGDKLILYSKNKKFIYWNIDTKKVEGTKPLPKNIKKKNTGLSHLISSLKGGYFFAAFSGGIKSTVIMGINVQRNEFMFIKYLNNAVMDLDISWDPVFLAITLQEISEDKVKEKGVMVFTKRGKEFYNYDMADIDTIGLRPVSLSKEKKYLAAADDDKAFVWNLEKNKMIYKHEPEFGSINDITLFSDHPVLLVGTGNNIQIVDFKNNKIENMFKKEIAISEFHHFHDEIICEYIKPSGKYIGKISIKKFLSKRFNNFDN